MDFRSERRVFHISQSLLRLPNDVAAEGSLCQPPTTFPPLPLCLPLLPLPPLPQPLPAPSLQSPTRSTTAAHLRSVSPRAIGRSHVSAAMPSNIPQCIYIIRDPPLSLFHPPRLHLQGTHALRLALYAFVSAIEHTCRPNVHSKLIPAALIELRAHKHSSPSHRVSLVMSSSYSVYLISRITPHVTPDPCQQANLRNVMLPIGQRLLIQLSIQKKLEALRLKFRDKAHSGLLFAQGGTKSLLVGAIGPALTGAEARGGKGEWLFLAWTCKRSSRNLG
jgi:hypothetical protein